MIKIKLNEVLQQKNKTKMWLTEQTGITGINLSKLSRGLTNSIRFDVLSKICDALDCKVEDILENIKEE